MENQKKNISNLFKDLTNGSKKQHQLSQESSNKKLSQNNEKNKKNPVILVEYEIEEEQQHFETDNDDDDDEKINKINKCKPCFWISAVNSNNNNINLHSQKSISSSSSEITSENSSDSENMDPVKIKEKKYIRGKYKKQGSVQKVSKSDEIKFGIDEIIKIINEYQKENTRRIRMTNFRHHQILEEVTKTNKTVNEEQNNIKLLHNRINGMANFLCTQDAFVRNYIEEFKNNNNKLLYLVAEQNTAIELIIANLRVQTNQSNQNNMILNQLLFQLAQNFNNIKEALANKQKI